MILSDSLSCLQSISNLKYDHPILVQILELYTELARDGRGIVFIRIPDHVAIRGIRRQILLLRMPSLAISRLNSSPSQT